MGGYVAGTSCGRKVIFDGEQVTIRATRGRGVEVKIPISEITLISFVRESRGGYIDFLSSGTSAHVEFRSGKRAEFERLLDAVERAVRVKPVRPREAASDKDMDPAALLVAVLAVGLGPLFGSGRWRILDTVVTLVILVIVVAYSLRQPARSSMGIPERTSVSLVVGLMCGVALAWPIQELFVLPYWYSRHVDVIGDRASDIGLGVGLAVAVAVWLWLRPRNLRGRVRALRGT
jgi:hypothetical protein